MGVGPAPGADPNLPDLAGGGTLTGLIPGLIGGTVAGANALIAGIISGAAGGPGLFGPTPGTTLSGIPTTPGINTATTNNPNYLMRVTSTDGMSLIADAPKEMEIVLNNSWMDLLSVISGALGGNILGNAAVAGFQFGQVVNGTYLVPPELTLQIWRKSDPLEFTVPFTFNAFRDPINEVLEPLRTLIRMAAPFREGAWLHAPGPSLADLAGGAGPSAPHLIALEVGAIINLRGLIISNLRIEWENRFTAEGLPIAARATVSFRTFYTYTREDYLSYLFNFAG